MDKASNYSTFQEENQRESAETRKNSRSDMSQSKDTPFWVAVVTTQAVGLACIGLAVYWMNLYKGFVWSDADLQFNYHPVFMVVGLIFCYGDAIIVYRVFSFLPKNILKIIHGSLHVSAIVLSSVALAAVLENHRRTKKADFYSLHSWIGIATFGLFCIQYIESFVAFMWPGLPLKWRSKMMPYHRFFGIGIFVMAIGSALMGITEKLLWTPNYAGNESIPEGRVGNTLGLFLIVFAFLIVFITSRPAYQRKPLPEEVTSIN